MYQEAMSKKKGRERKDVIVCDTLSLSYVTIELFFKEIALVLWRVIKVEKSHLPF